MPNLINKLTEYVISTLKTLYKHDFRFLYPYQLFKLQKYEHFTFSWIARFNYRRFHARKVQNFKPLFAQLFWS